MFLNLKNKRVETALQNHLKAHNHPKTQRDERPERASKEQCDRPNKRAVPSVMIKKQTASTALTTMQAGSSCSNVAHHYVIHRLDSTEKEGESIGKSIEKLDSQRSQRIANAYRKIKKHEGERTFTEQPLEEPPRKSHNRTQYPLNKKEIVTNFANNYIAITEADEQDSKRDRNTERDAVAYFSKLIELFLQVFRKDGKLKGSVVKFRSLSSKEIDLNDSVERSKRSNKNLKGKSKPLQATQRSHHEDDVDTFQDIIEKFTENLAKSQEKADALNNERWIDVGILVKQLYTEIGQFVKELQVRFISDMEERYEQYEKGLEIVVMQQAHMEDHCKHLEQALAIERNRTSILAQSLEEMHNKTLYCSAFFNQISFNIDLDTFLREKICEFAGEGCSLINSHFHSTSSLALKQEFLDADFAFYKEKKKG